MFRKNRNRVAGQYRNQKQKSNIKILKRSRKQEFRQNRNPELKIRADHENPKSGAGNESGQNRNQKQKSEMIKKYRNQELKSETFKKNQNP